MAAGDLRATLEAAGTPIGPYDLLIAAQALRRDATLVTANPRRVRPRSEPALGELGGAEVMHCRQQGRGPR